MSNNIIIERTSIQWKSPIPGTPTRRVPDHYFGRNVHALVDGEENIYRLKPKDIALEATEEDMINVVKTIVDNEKEVKETENAK
ncbi:hypothetical protein ACFSKI_01620 [Pseudogracilibacillus auburnensis]|uniref:hypothetical protein n=1 Tax=Pseudogracilibacillus auburnensis TaxID=1494959 RepID=UPI00362E43C9